MDLGLPISHLLGHCGGLAAGERVAIIVDSKTEELGRAFAAAARRQGAIVAVEEVPVAPAHGTEPTQAAAAVMAASDLIIGLTWMSMAHTSARRQATDAGARYLSLPEYTKALLHDPAVMVDYRAQESVVRRVADAFTAGSTVRVTSAAGTDMRLDIRGRVGNCCPGFVRDPGSLGSPPDIEANVSPIETASEGIVVVDASVPCPEIGLLRRPLVLRVQGGRITAFEGEDAKVVASVRKLFERVGSDKAYVLAECGIGLNPMARVSGSMLTDEGAAGCVHFGFGSNCTVGGLNDVGFHLDFVFRDAAVAIDGLPFDTGVSRHDQADAYVPG